MFSNELGPTTNRQAIFIFSSLLISLFFQIKVFGEISIIWDSWCQESQKWQHKLDAANETMCLMKLSEGCKDEIRDFLLVTNTTQELADEKGKFLEKLSDSRKALVQSKFFEEMLQRSRVIHKLIGKD